MSVEAGSAVHLYVSVDLEGATGVTRRAELAPPGADYPAARRWMTADVNAAVAGARRTGDVTVTVEENHGAEQTCVLDLDVLDADVTVVRGMPRGRVTTAAALDETVDAIALVGHHAAINDARGVLAHTISGLFTDVRLDGRTRSEGEFFVRMGAELGVPTIMASGDDVTCAQLRELVPTLETAPVKRAMSYESAAHRPATQARAAIADATERGLRRLAREDFTLVPVSRSGHEVEVDLGPQALAFRPLMADLGFGLTGDRTVRREVASAAAAWEAGVTVAAVVMLHVAVGRTEPDEAVVASLLRRS